MPGQLYALQSDLDMLTQDVHELKRSYNSVDYIAHTMKNLWDEQVCQGAQMRRMETRMAEIETVLSAIGKEQARHAMRLDKLEQRMSKIEEFLGKIVKHMGIK